jgi:hypothetical protein
MLQDATTGRSHDYGHWPDSFSNRLYSSRSPITLHARRQLDTPRANVFQRPVPPRSREHAMTYRHQEVGNGVVLLTIRHFFCTSLSASSLQSQIRLPHCTHCCQQLLAQSISAPLSSAGTQHNSQTFTHHDTANLISRHVLHFQVATRC